MSRIDGNRQESTGVEHASVARSSKRQLPIGVQIACEAPLVATRFLSIPADSCRLGSGTTWQPSRPAHVDSPRPARPPIWACPNPVAASHPTREISLRNVPKRNPTCATPHIGGRSLRDRQNEAHAKPKRSRIDRNRQESSVPARGPSSVHSTADQTAIIDICGTSDECCRFPEVDESIAIPKRPGFT